MTNKIETGGPAFPEARIRNGDNYNAPTKVYYGGMTLRDYFAAQVLPTVYQTAMQDALIGKNVFYDENWRVDLAMNVYKMADAMLKARGEK
jgi:hypothetical protein